MTFRILCINLFPYQSLFLCLEESTPIEIPHLSATMAIVDRVSRRGSQCKYILAEVSAIDLFNKSPQSTDNYEPYPRPVTTSPITQPVTAYLALTTNNAGLVLNGVGMRKIDRQEAAARFSRLYKTRPESCYWRRARDVNRDQIRHHKVKGPRWPSLRGIPESVFVARGKLLTLYLNASRRIFHFRESLAIWIKSRSER